MNQLRTFIAMLCTLALGSFAVDQAAGQAADQPGSPPAPQPQAGAGAGTDRPLPITERGVLGSITEPYRGKIPAAINLTNSPRLEALIRGGNLYLSLLDTVALALENNLDIELQRYTPQIADSNLFRAQAGGFATPATTTVFAGPSSVTAAAPSAGLQGLLVAGSTQIGPAPPSFDPALIGGLSWAHQSTPQTSNFITGTNALVQRQDGSSLSVQKYFETGTLVNLGLSNNSTTSNASRSDFSPVTNSALSLTVTQHLLQGWGSPVNTRQIRIAKNNREVSDLTFKAQVITTVAAIMDLYWDLVSYNENVRVQADALAANERLLRDNTKQVEVGTLASIEIVRAQAEIAASQQAVTVAQTQLLQQEIILKNALSRTGVINPAVASAHVILTDHIQVPGVEAISPIQDLVAQAFASRPELAQFRILMQNQEIGIRGTRAELLPVLDLVGGLSNNGLAGTVNPLPGTGGVPRAPTGFFIGGYGTVLSQLFQRNFPNYSLGFNLNVPLRNRAAQADLINSELALRQQQIGVQRMENQVRVEVQNAVIGVQQARAQYESAIKQRTLQQQTVEAEQKKLEMGVSTTYNVILTQRDLTTAESNLVAAESAYSKSKVEMDRATGQTLYNNNVSLDEAFKGKVARPPSAIPEAAPRQ
ncbi:MAG TPA: TolC family protein [Candidatus Acidoferrales bacterium]|nr:TolC family protein [Candidatus Acidoferrales bacterium]